MFASTSAFSIQAQQRAIDSFLHAGFENVRFLKEDSTLNLAFESRVYRWNVKGIVIALDSLLVSTDSIGPVRLVLLSMDIPRVMVSTNLRDWRAFREGRISKKQYADLLIVTYDVDEVWEKISGQKKYKPAQGDVDLILYTELKVKNIFYDQLYDTQINFAPALDIRLWKGSKATVQWLFPLTNSARSFGKRGDKIRPGFVTLNQEFRFVPRLYTNLSGGLFNQERSGVAMQHTYDLNPYVSFAGSAAYTGTNRSYGSDWSFGTWNKFTWSAGGTYFNPRFETQAGISVNKFVTDDIGVRFDLVRMFGEVAVGLYGMVSQEVKDAGFNVTIPFPGSKRPQYGHFRVMLPKYFDWEYSSSNNIGKSFDFETRPNENRIEFLFNPAYLKAQILDF